jgi:hypothetical protein
MGGAVGEVVLFGVGVALTPLAAIAVVLMLDAPGGRRSGAAFLGAFALALASVATVALLLADVADADGGGTPARWVAVVKVALGVALALFAAGQWRGRPRADEQAELPGFLQGVDAFTPPQAAALAVVLAAVKPKNLLLTIGAAVAVAQTGADAAAQALALAVFVVLGSLAPGIPVGIALLMRARGDRILARAREWMIRENATITAVLCLAIAVKLLIDGIGALAG